jgi:hypothetical protein
MPAKPTFAPCAAVAAVVAAIAGCDAADTTVDPGDLELRDLLGFDPRVAARWDGEKRAAPRAVLQRGLGVADARVSRPLAPGVELDRRIAITVAAIDDDRAAAHDGALGLIRLDVVGDAVEADPVPIVGFASASPAGAPLERARDGRGDHGDAIEPRSAPHLLLAPAWPAELVLRGVDLLAHLAVEAGHADGPVLVVPATRLAVIAAYVVVEPAPRLWVNPVLLWAIEPSSADAAAAAPATATTSVTWAPADQPAPAAANPYSFYGSIGECAYAEQLRCDGCRPTSACEPRTRDGDGDQECDAFAADDGRGYQLWCVNMAVAISGVEACVADAAPSCPRDPRAVESLADLADNAVFVDTPTCAAALDSCLAERFGPSQGSYPVPPGDDPVPPRSTSIGCADPSPNCSFDPSCDLRGPSCDNSLSCDTTCADSASQGGCGGSCDACTSSGGGGCISCEGSGDGDSGGGGGGGCISCEGSGDGDSGDGCGSPDGCGDGCGGGDGAGCGGDGDGGCGGGGSAGCGGDGCGSDGCTGRDPGGGDSSCGVARRPRPPRTLGLLVQLAWVLLPIPAAGWALRRSRRRRDRAREDEVSW